MNPLHNYNKYLNVYLQSHESNQSNEAENALPTSTQISDESFSHQAVAQSHLQKQVEALLSTTKFNEIEQEAIEFIKKIASSDLSEQQLSEIHTQAKSLEKKLEQEQHPNAIHLKSLMQKIYTHNDPTFLHDQCVFSSLFTNVIQAIMVEDCKVKLQQLRTKNGIIFEQDISKGFKSLVNLLSKRINFSAYEIDLLFNATQIKSFTVGLNVPCIKHAIEIKKTSLKFLHNLHDFLNDEHEFKKFINEQTRFTFFGNAFDFRNQYKGNQTTRSCLTGLYLLLFSYNNLQVISKIPNHILSAHENEINALISIVRYGKKHKLAPLELLLREKGLRVEKQAAKGVLGLNTAIHCQESAWSERPFSFKSENQMRFLKNARISNCISQIGDFDFETKFKISKLYKDLHNALSKRNNDNDEFIVRDLSLHHVDDLRCDIVINKQELENKLHKSFYIHTTCLFLLLCQETTDSYHFHNRIIYTYLAMLKQELSNSNMRQKFTFEDWLTTPFNAIFFDNKTKKGSVDTAEYTWVTLIETFAKNVETMPYSNEINKYDSLVLKKFIEKETGIAIVLDPIEEEIHTEILPTNQTTEILSWVESIENHANGDEIVPHIQVSEEILPSTAIEPMQEDPIEKLLDHLKPIPEQPSLFSSLSLSQVSLPQNLEKISTRPPVPSYLNNSLAEELNRVLTSQLLHPPSISLAVPAAITPVQPKKSALKRTFSSLAETGSDPAVQQTQQAQKRLSFAIEENRPARTKPVIKKARVIPLEMPNTSTSSRIARIKSATQPIELIRPIQRPVDSQISYKAFPYSTPLDYPIIAQFQGTPEETAAPFFSHDRDWIIHKIHQARSNNIGTVISGLTLLDKMYIYADFFRTSVSKGPGNHLLLMTEISDWFYKELDAALTANSNQKGKQPQLDITPTIILCKTKRDLLSALKAEKQNVLILTSHGVAKVVDHSFFHEFTLKSIIIDDVQTNENDNISPVREFIRNQCKKTEEPNQEQPAILWSTKTLYENHISELYTQLSLINPDKFSTATAKALNEILSDTLSKLTKIDQYSESKQFQAQVYNAFGHFYHFKQVLAHAAFAIRKDETTVSSPFNTFFQENINEERTAWEKFLGDSSADLSHDFALWCDVLVRSAYRICYKDKNPIIADALAATLNEYVDMLKKDTSTDMLEEQIQQLTPRISTKQTSPTVAVDHSTIVNTTILDADAEISERELIVIPLPKETSREFTEKLGVLLLNAANDPSSKYLISQICRILDTEDGQKLRRAVREGTLEHKARIPHEVKAKELNSLLNKFYDKAQKNQKNEIPYSVCVYKFQNSSHKGELGKFRLIESQKNPQARHTIRLYVSQNATPGDCHYDLLVRKNSSRKDT